MVSKNKPLDLDAFYKSRQEIAGEIGTIYAQRQVAGIRQLVQEAKLAEVQESKREVKPQKETK